MKFLPTLLSRSAAVALCLTGAIFFSACNRGRGRVLEIAYVAAVQANLRDQVAAVYEKAGVVKNGDRVEVLDHDRRFVKVRTPKNEIGWLEAKPGGGPLIEPLAPLLRELFEQYASFDFSWASFFSGDIRPCEAVPGLLTIGRDSTGQWELAVKPGTSALFDLLRERDVLLHHPYDSYSTVVRFIESAAQDPGHLPGP